MIYPEINYLVPSHVTKYVYMWIERKGKREVTHPKPGDMYLTFAVLPLIPPNHLVNFSQNSNPGNSKI